MPKFPEASTISAGEDSGLLSSASGYAPDCEETETRIRRIQTKQVVIFWIGTAAALGAAGYVYQAAKYKFEAKRIAGYLQNGTNLAYSVGYLIEKAQASRIAGVSPYPDSPSPPGAPPAPSAPESPMYATPKTTEDFLAGLPRPEGYMPPPPPAGMPFPIHDA